MTKKDPRLGHPCVNLRNKENPCYPQGCKLGNATAPLWCEGHSDKITCYEPPEQDKEQEIIRVIKDLICVEKEKITIMKELNKTLTLVAGQMKVR